MRDISSNVYDYYCFDRVSVIIKPQILIVFNNWFSIENFTVSTKMKQKVEYWFTVLLKVNCRSYSIEINSIFLCC